MKQIPINGRFHEMSARAMTKVIKLFTEVILSVSDCKEANLGQNLDMTEVKVDCQ